MGGENGFIQSPQATGFSEFPQRCADGFNQSRTLNVVSASTLRQAHHRFTHKSALRLRELGPGFRYRYRLG